jgi:hypothetical protein
MKAIKKGNNILVLLEETYPGMQELVEKYAETGEYEVITMLACPLCQQSGWVSGWVEEEE